MKRPVLSPVVAVGVASLLGVEPTEILDGLPRKKENALLELMLFDRR